MMGRPVPPGNADRIVPFMVVQHHATERWKFLFWAVALSLCGLAAMNVMAVLEAVDHDRPASIVVIETLACLAGLMGLFELRKAFVTMLEAHYGVPMAGAVLNALNYRLDAATIACARD